MADEDDRKEEPECGSRFPDPPAWDYNVPPSEGKKESDYTGIAEGVKFAYYLIGPLVAGWLVGYLIDRSRGGTDGQVWGAIIGFFVGIAVMATLINRAPGGKT